MRGFSPLARLITLLVALLQLAAPTLASVADARLERDRERSPHAAAHLESHSTPACPQAHPDDCALCQLISAVAIASRATPQLPPSAAVLAGGAAAPHDLRAGKHSALARPRAPPTS